VIAPRRRNLRRALAAAPAAALLALAPAAGADPPQAGLSISIPPLLNLSIPGQAGPLEPGLRLLIPQILDLTLPIDISGSGFPVGGVRLSLTGLDLPSDIGLFVGGLLSINGLGDGLAALVPSLAVAPDLAVGAATGKTDLTCPLDAVVTLGNEVQATVTLGTRTPAGTPCTSTSGVPYKGATGTLSGSGTFQSTDAGSSGAESGTLTLTWDNGDTSTISENASLQTGGTSIDKAPIKGAAPLMARDTGGALQGDSVDIQETSADFTGDSIHFVGTVTIRH
jgi:hypothetical protein